MRTAVHLKLVRDAEPPPVEAEPAPARRLPDRGDLALVAILFLLNLVPVAGVVTGIGRWSAAVAGFAAGAVLLTGRELWSQLRARATRNTDRKEGPP
jgi:hypothetical protein